MKFEAVTRAPTESHRPRWILSFLAVVLATLAVLLVAGSASALTDPTTQNAVGALARTADTAVGSSANITAGQRLAHRATAPDFVVATGVAANTVRFGPMNPGPLAGEVASTFRSSSYTMSELSEATTLYRAYGGKAGPLGSYWSRVKPSGPLQAQLDSALNPAWGNSATGVATIRVPSGTTIYEGAAASQPIGGGGSLLGGGSQVYIPRVDSSWLVP
ncbi:filamentous hemagglutinin [Demequina soli]|uniref:filamentous hemagglutinin n=1 Tax=Demequina soli TaxID=1638987 RepID=UPI0012E0BCBF|nr:filamentous hemagglutinin [Demequina soli]